MKTPIMMTAKQLQATKALLKLLDHFLKPNDPWTYRPIFNAYSIDNMRHIGEDLSTFEVYDIIRTRRYLGG